MEEKFEQEIKRTKGHELLWAYSKGGSPGPGMEMDGLDMLRAVGNEAIEEAEEIANKQVEQWKDQPNPFADGSYRTAIGIRHSIRSLKKVISTEKI